MTESDSDVSIFACHYCSLSPQRVIVEVYLVGKFNKFRAFFFGDRFSSVSILLGALEEAKRLAPIK
jgi:hypothetical protein